MIGQTLAHYRVQEKIGEGGMGEVYRARDSKLGREVAIKVLPAAFAADPERLGRFQREAQLLASLNHPNIGAIYGLEEADGVRFLVLELVAGETLAERLAAGPLPREEAVRLCRQIAEALEAAHEKGIIHRDLKPGNVKVTPEGKVKVLDFGLAKAFESEAASKDMSKSPTLSSPAATQRGVLLGTAAYMSPEQARGKPLDKRTDIWSFGCVLYETLTGRQAFRGETVTDTMAAIVKEEPDWRALPADTPATLRTLLRRCLQKDPARRLRDIADVRLELEETAGAEAAVAATLPAAVAAPRPAWRRFLPGWALTVLVAVLAALAAGLGVWKLRPATPPQPVARLVIPVAATDALDVGVVPAVALSPDGRYIAYAATRGGNTQLFLRPIDQFEATPIPGTEGASGPFFSPNGEWIAFFGGGKLKKVPTSGGAALTLCDAPAPRGGSWGDDDTIFYTPSPSSGLFRVAAGGGTPQPASTLDTAQAERSHRWPEALPGGKAVLFTLDTGRTFDEASIAVLSLKTGRHRVVAQGGSNPHYVPTGHIVYGRNGVLLAVPFDLSRLQVTGPPVPVLEGVVTQPYTGAAQFSFSRSGALAYVPGTARLAERSLLWVDRHGTAKPLTQSRRGYLAPRFSPDGRRLAVEVVGATVDVWVLDLGRDTFTRLTFERNNYAPVWSPDGKRLVFSSDRAARPDLYWKPSDGSRSEERLTTAQLATFASSWSPDGRALLVRQINPNTGSDIMVQPLEGDRKPSPLVATNFDERQAQFSPDGHWFAYVSNESGRDEVYVQPYPGPGGKWQISTEGGTEPVWARNGRELFYRTGDKMMVVAIQTQPAFTAGTPRLLFEGRYERPLPRHTNYDISPDGQHFVMVKGEQETPVSQLNVVLNWFGDLKRRAASGQK